MTYLYFTLLLLHTSLSQASTKVQEINFEDLQIEGKSINPEGSFLVQRPGVDFKPIIELKTDVDKKLRTTHRRLK